MKPKKHIGCVLISETVPELDSDRPGVVKLNYATILYNLSIHPHALILHA